MRFFALTTATADLPEVPDIQESLTAIQKFIKTASPVVLNALWHIALALVIFFVRRWLIEKFLSRVALLDNKTKVDPGVAKFVRSLVRVALWALLIYFIADFLGADGELCGAAGFHRRDGGSGIAGQSFQLCGRAHSHVPAPL